MKGNAVLFDTSFFLRFLNEIDPLFKNADGYFRYFLDKDTELFISTISIAEYCVGGDFDELPLKYFTVLPFQINHATRTGAFAKTVFQHKGKLSLKERNIIPNDTKLFAQAHEETSIGYYLSSDRESLKIYNLLKSLNNPTFQFLDLSVPVSEIFE